MKNKCYSHVLFTILIVIFAVFCGHKNIQAADIFGDFITKDDIKNIVFSFEEPSYDIIQGDSVKLKLDTNLPYSYITSVECISDNNDIAYISGYIDEQGYITVNAYEAGVTTVTVSAYVSYYNADGYPAGEEKINCKSTVNVIKTSDRQLEAGDITVFDYSKYTLYKDMKYEVDNEDAFSVTNAGVVAANRAGFTNVYLVDNKTEFPKRVNIGSITAFVSNTSISENNIYRAVNSAPYMLSIQGLTVGSSVTWSSSDEKIAKVSADGTVTPVNVGDVTITATVEKLSGAKIPYTCTVHITNPVLSISTLELAKDYSADISVKGTEGQVSWISDNTNIAMVSPHYSSNGVNAVVRGVNEGSTVIHAQVDGIDITCIVTITDPHIVKTFYVVPKGSKQVIKVRNVSADSAITYTSSNVKVAAVSAKGVIRARKGGFAKIIVHVDNAEYIISVNVGSKKGVKAVLNAMKAEGAIYSQAKRMSKGYYDCSSLVWRSYSPLGIYFGDRYYAPVAAAEASYLVSQKKTVPKKYKYKLNKLRPGDLFFFKGEKNGRYKNIYHVAIYMGQECTSFFGMDYTFGKIIHAGGVSVTQGYMYNQDNIVVIGRPTK